MEHQLLLAELRQHKSTFTTERARLFIPGGRYETSDIVARYAGGHDEEKGGGDADQAQYAIYRSDKMNFVKACKES